MPLYSYQCRDCGFEQEQIEDSDVRTVFCNHCESAPSDRLPSVAGGYKIKGRNDASVSPKGAASFKGGRNVRGK